MLTLCWDSSASRPSSSVGEPIKKVPGAIPSYPVGQSTLAEQPAQQMRMQRNGQRKRLGLNVGMVPSGIVGPRERKVERVHERSERSNPTRRPASSRAFEALHSGGIGRASTRGSTPWPPLCHQMSRRQSGGMLRLWHPGAATRSLGLISSRRAMARKVLQTAYPPGRFTVGRYQRCHPVLAAIGQRRVAPRKPSPVWTAQTNLVVPKTHAREDITWRTQRTTSHCHGTR